MAQLSTAPRETPADAAVVRVRPAAGAAGHPDIVRTWAKTPDRARAAREVAAATARLIEDTGAGLQLAEADLSGLDLRGFDLRQSTLNRAVLHSTDLSGANLICPGMERTKFRGANLSGAYVHAFAAQVCDFSGADLSRLVDATGSLFRGCNLAGARFDGAALAGATFYQCALDGASLTRAKLQGATINECTMVGADFGHALVSQLTVTKSLMTGASFARASSEGLVLQRPTGADGLDLRDARLPALRPDSVKAAKLEADGLGAPGADIRACELSGARLRHAALERSRWVASRFEGADLSGARLDGASFHDCAARGVRLEDASAENLSAVECSFADAHMRHFAGRCASFRDCDLSRTDLREAYLYRSSFTGDPPKSMAMAGVVLAGAVLVQAYLSADLSGADRGKSAFVLAWLSRRHGLGKLLCVDPWSAAHRHQNDDGGRVNDWAARMDFDAALEVFEINLAGFGGGAINYLRIPSHAGARVYAHRATVETPVFGRTRYEGRIALLHIDGNHDFGHVRRDAIMWTPMVAPGGWIVFDDYTWAFGDGPKRVGDEFLNTNAGRIETAFVAGAALFIRLAGEASA